MPLYAEVVRRAWSLEKIPSVWYAWLPPAVSDAGFNEFAGMEELVPSALAWAGEAVRRIRAGVFWPPAPEVAYDRFEALAQRLLTQFPDARLVITGARDERDAAEAMCRAINSPRVVSAAGRTSLRDLLTLYALSDVLVTNDSGPAHFASLTRIRTVVLFGPETPALFGSRAPGTTIIWKQLACSPCVSVFNHRLSPCTNNVCMQMITVDDVCAAVQGAIGR